MQTKEVKISHKQELGAELKSIAPDVSLKDKEAFMIHSGYKKSTLSDYLRGKVSNIDVAMDMLLFFRKRIAHRKEVINDL